MSYLALYRKYRPDNFKDLVGQSEVASIIKNEILKDKISHAYLFSGPRGTGKTSTAKIIAKMINCNNLDENGIPCGKCESCVNFNSSSDIVEIDAASNNGVDEIRELRDKVNLVPTYGKYKIYIIDEVHMLTTQAFNALLKTLEEPPAHIVFILATTEFYKIPVTVVSRCQKFQFLKFSNDDIVKRLLEISEKEQIQVTEDVLLEIARLSDGGLRDAINMLDQLSSFNGECLNVQDVYKLNGVVSFGDFNRILNYVLDNDIVNLVKFFDDIDKNGKSLERFVEDFISFVKDIFIYKNTKVLETKIEEKNEIIKSLADKFSFDNLYKLIIEMNDLSIRLKNSSFGKILLITQFIHICNFLLSNNNSKESYSDKKTNDNSLVNQLKIEKEKESISFNTGGEHNKNANLITDKIKKIRINNTFATASKMKKEQFLKKFNEVSEIVSNSSNYVLIAGMMSDIEVLVVGDKNIIFKAQYNSLLERLYENLELIESLLFEVYKINYRVVFLLEDEWLYEKEKYILGLKNGKSYSYIEENNVSNVGVGNSDVDSDIGKIVSLLGEDIVSYEVI